MITSTDFMLGVFTDRSDNTMCRVNTRLNTSLIKASIVLWQDSNTVAETTCKCFLYKIIRGLLCAMV